jgi:hypothetical protein
MIFASPFMMAKRITAPREGRYAIARAGCAWGCEHVGQRPGDDAAADCASMPRRLLMQEPHWSPMPQRWSSRTLLAPPLIALMTSFSFLPRQMQMITSMSWFV